VCVSLGPEGRGSFGNGVLEGVSNSPD
jgi:hypothetical protein